MFYSASEEKETVKESDFLNKKHSQLIEHKDYVILGFIEGGTNFCKQRKR